MHGIPRGIGLQVKLFAPRPDSTIEHYFTGNQSWGWRDFFDKPWAEAVCEGSPHFPEGEMKVEVEVRLLVNE